MSSVVIIITQKPLAITIFNSSTLSVNNCVTVITKMVHFFFFILSALKGVITVLFGQTIFFFIGNNK